MLVLTRLTDERVFIGDDIIVKVLGVSGGIVRLGFEAPKSVAIVREDARERSAKHASETPK